MAKWIMTDRKPPQAGIQVYARYLSKTACSKDITLATSKTNADPAKLH
jgi:hypothetical protein